MSNGLHFLLLSTTSVRLTACLTKRTQVHFSDDGIPHIFFLFSARSSLIMSQAMRAGVPVGDGPKESYVASYELEAVLYGDRKVTGERRHFCSALEHLFNAYLGGHI